jgi:S1-C subfamily serine protease
MQRYQKILVILAVITFTLLSCRTLSFQASEPVVTLNPPPTQANPTPLPTHQTSPTSLVTPIAPDLVSLEETLVALYEAVNPGVVAIQVVTRTGGGSGSGFVIDEEGHIVTNYHVIEGAEDLEVSFSNGLRVRAEIVGTDTDSDLAILKVDVSPGELHPIPLGDSSALKVGQTVVAIGNPFRLSGTMTVGIVSGQGRTLDSLRTSPDGRNFSAGDLIQTDAAINPGNSGGPLLNLNGEVIGVNRAIRTFNFTATEDPVNSGIGFAIAVNIVKRVVPSLIAEGHYDYPYLGISSLPEISLFQQEALGLPQATGAYVTNVLQGSPADQAGLRGGDPNRASNLANIPPGGDLIVAVDGVPVREFSELLSYLFNNKSPDETILLTVLRGDQELEIELTLGKRP